MMISDKTMAKARERLATLLDKAGAEKKRELSCRIAETEKSDKDVCDAVTWLIAYSPLCDIANYDFDMFLSFAEHGVFLKRNCKFLEGVPEEIFLNYVLHPRMGGEEICDCRKFFYELLMPRISGLTAKEAIIELNYFNAESVMYRTTDYRTLTALGTYNSAYGRCGEESVFAVNVYRALGIPSRQIYTPRWAHCDDNHAWVEVWCDGDWHFLGACEPEEVLDKGWFTGAAGRAMLVQCRTFGEVSEDVLARIGMAFIVDDLHRYAAYKRLTVTVRDEERRPVQGAKIAIGILNHSHIFPTAVFVTDVEGKASFNCGMGSLNIRVMKGDISFERMVYVPDVSEVEFILRREEPEWDVWQDFVSIAPKDGVTKGNRPTEEQKKLCSIKTAAANEKREKKVEGMFDALRTSEAVEKFGYSHKIADIVREGRGNGGELLNFLENESFSPSEKENILLTLTEKDWRDVKIEVLIEALEVSRQYKGNFEDEKFFYEYVVCPRVWFETLTLSRKFILSYFTDEQKAAFKSDPALIQKYIEDNFSYYPELEYGQTITNPKGMLTVKSGNEMSRKILFVSICRALGIAARLNPVNLLAEYYDGRFIAVKSLEKGDCKIVLERGEGSWQYLSDFAVGVLDGGNYRNLELEDEKWQGDEMTVCVKSGEYRIITDNRMPNGNLFASKYHFKLSAGEVKRIKLHRYEADLSDMLLGYSFEDFSVKDAAGKPVGAAELTRERTVMMWLSEGAEPTEHILNEMLERKAEFEALPCGIAFMLKDESALNNAKLKKVLDEIDKIRVFYDDSPNSELLARRMFLDPEKLPIIVIAKDLIADYACGGYNVGSGDMIVKICKLLSKKGK